MPRHAATKKGRDPVIVATGVDLVELDRIQHLLKIRGSRFVTRVYTPAEAAYCSAQADVAASFGARFAAKEAVLKCLGTGWGRGLGFIDVEVVRAPSGAVRVRLSGPAAAVARSLGIARIHLSLSHGRDHAVAFAVAEA
jgi:holo-[acyl-carrier protein] synthase